MQLKCGRQHDDDVMTTRSPQMTFVQPHCFFFLSIIIIILVVYNVISSWVC